jgi:hypothetical protein
MAIWNLSGQFATDPTLELDSLHQSGVNVLDAYHRSESKFYQHASWMYVLMCFVQMQHCVS